MISRIGDLKRRFDWLKVVDGTGKAKYERTMFLYKDRLKGVSAAIPDSSGWKYGDPRDNQDALDFDYREFQELKRDLMKSAMLNPRQDFAAETYALQIADAMYRRAPEGGRPLRITIYSLVKFCQLLDITADGSGICQLHLFIQDGLRDLQAVRLPKPPEEETEIGEATLSLNRGGDVKKVEMPLTIREGEAKVGMAL